MTKFARTTSVNVAQTRGDIAAVLGKYGATPFDETDLLDEAVIRFDASGYHIRFNLPLPLGWANYIGGPATPMSRPVWSKWRALHLCIKAKLEAIESGIETFEEAFFAEIVGLSGKTMSEQYMHLLPAKEFQHIECPYCKTKNRVPIGTKLEDARCGHCHRPLRETTSIGHNAA